jgi:ABC-type multidrug transport system fused ATPase/permease subunit
VSNSQTTSSFTALSLRTAGIILIAITVLNLALALFPGKFQDIQWQLSITNQFIDRGIVPLIGLVFLIAASWVERISGNGGALSPVSRVLIFGFASLLGLIFILLVPFNINTTRLAYAQALERINQDVSRAEAELATRIPNEVENQRTKIQLLLKDPQQLDAAVKSGQIQGEQLKLLEQFKANPKAVDAFLEQERKKAEADVRQQIETRKKEATQQTDQDAWSATIRVCFSSLLLAGGYVLIGWTGLRNVKG